MIKTIRVVSLSQLLFLIVNISIKTHVMNALRIITTMVKNVYLQTQCLTALFTMIVISVGIVKMDIIFPSLNAKRLKQKIKQNFAELIQINPNVKSVLMIIISLLLLRVKKYLDYLQIACILTKTTLVPFALVDSTGMVLPVLQ